MPTTKTPDIQNPTFFPKPSRKKKTTFRHFLPTFPSDISIDILPKETSKIPTFRHFHRHFQGLVNILIEHHPNIGYISSPTDTCFGGVKQITNSWDINPNP